MAQSYARIAAAIKAAVDAGSNAVQKFILGTPGSKVMLPPITDPDMAELSSSHDTGTMWGGNTIPLLLTHVGADIDGAGISWAHLETQGAGSPVLIKAGRNVTSAVKNTAANPDVLTITMSPGFTSSYWCPIIAVFNRTAFSKITIMNATQVQVSFLNHDGISDLGVDSQTVFFVGVGQH